MKKSPCFCAIIKFYTSSRCKNHSFESQVLQDLAVCFTWKVTSSQSLQKKLFTNGDLRTVLIVVLLALISFLSYQ